MFTANTMSLVNTFWGLDKKMAQRKHFPSVNWLRSFTKYVQNLEPYYETQDIDFIINRKKCCDILELEDKLTEKVALVGKVK